jgi:magnesium transporter
MTQDTITLTDLVARKDLDAIDRWLDEHGALDVADELARLEPSERAVVFRLLAKDRALAVFEALDPIHQQQLLDALADESVNELFLGIDPDDRARLTDEMPAKVANRLLAGLPETARKNTNILLGYPEESVGRIMSPRYVSLRASLTAADALTKVRRAGLRSREVLVLPVTDDQRRLVGVVDLPDVVTAASGTRIDQLIRPETYSVRVDDDQEVGARLMQEADLVALPVLDTESRLVGVLTVDDAMEILEQEETEDISRAGGAEPLTVPYMEATVLQLARKRATWLLVLILAAVATVNVLGVFEDTLEEVLALALFIPLLIDTGGNSGSQAATVVIRAMAVGEVRFSDLPRVLKREVVVGLLLGLMLGVVAIPIVWAFFGIQFALVIGSTLFVICTWASFSGGLLPIVAKRIGIDPAVVSAPLITTLVDATGLIIYFLLAQAILGIG